MNRFLRVCGRWAAALLLLPSLALAADPQIAEFVDSPDPAVAGGLYAYTIRVDNDAVDAAVNTRLLVSVPRGASFVSASPASANCAPLSATQVACNLGTLGASKTDVRIVTMTWRATIPGLDTIDATAQVSADNNINVENDAQTQRTTVVPGANLSLVMSDSPDPVATGGNVTYVLTMTNPGLNDVGDLTVVNDLPPTSTFVSATGSGWSCSAAGSRVTCTRFGVHAVGAAIPAITIVARANELVGFIENTATVSTGVGGVADPDTSDNTVTARTTILAGADIQIASKTVTSALPVTAGGDVTFVIAPRNAGPQVATSVRVEDVLPAGWSFISAAGPNWTCPAPVGQTVACTRATMPAGATDDITIVARAPAAVPEGGLTVTNTATISASSTDPVGTNNSGSATFRVLRDGADLGIDKFKVPGLVAVGGTLTSTITVTNFGPRTATGNVRVVEVLTRETWTAGAFSGSGWSCAAFSANVVVCDHPNAGGLAVGAALPQLVLTTTSAAAGDNTNTACTSNLLPSGVVGPTTTPPTNTGGDPNTTNDCFTSNSTATVGSANPDLGITAAITTPVGGDNQLTAAEASATFTATITNTGAPGTGPAATGARLAYFIEAYTAGSTVVTSSNFAVLPTNGSTATFSCTGTLPSGSCTQTGGTFNAGDSATLSVVLTRPIGRTWPGLGGARFIVSVANDREADTVTANNSAQAELFVEPIADVEVTGKTVSPGTTRAGENVTYVVSFRNNGPDAADNTVLRDVFSFFQADGTTPSPADPGLTLVSITPPTAVGWGCDLAAGAVITPAANTLTCQGFLPAGQADTVTVVFRVNSQAGNPVRVVNNEAIISTSVVESPDPASAYVANPLHPNTNNRKSAALRVQTDQIDLLVNRSDVNPPAAVDPVAYIPGNTFINHSVRVTSNGPSFGTNVRITETMTPPPGKRIRFVCDTDGFGSATCNADQLCSVRNEISVAGTALSFSCQVPVGNATTGLGKGELVTGQSKDIFLRYEVLDQPPSAGDVFVGTATVASDQTDTFLNNNTITERTTTRQRVDIRVTKTPSVATVNLRQPFTWTITVTNNGPGDAALIDLTDTLPSGVVVTGPITWTRTLPAGSGSCTQSGASINCLMGSLTASGVSTITLPVRIDSMPTGGSVTNTATVDVSASKLGADDFPGGNHTATSTVPVVRASLAGTVFEDRDVAGANAGTPQAAAGEPRIAGVSVRLTGTDLYGNAVDRSTTTDASGNYIFTDLSPSNAAGYALSETQPTGFLNGPVDPPTAGGSQPSLGGTYARGGVAGNSSYTAIPVASGVDGVNYNFPEALSTSISGTVYIDRNANVTMEPVPTDGRLAGVTLTLYAGTACSGTPVATTTSDASGAYVFQSLTAGLTYTVCETQPTGYLDGGVNPGTSGSSPAANAITITALPAGGSSNNLFAERAAAVAGRVFLDAENDGNVGASDTGIPGVVVTLSGTDVTGAAVSRTATTDASGNFRFDDLVASGPGGYVLTEQTAQPVVAATTTLNGRTVAGTIGGTPTGAGTAATTVPSVISGIVLPAGGLSIDNRFGEILPVSLRGLVFSDPDNNGVQNLPADVGLSGVTITLSGTDDNGAAVSRTTATTADGSFAFADLRPGTYTLTEPTQPVNTGNGQTIPGSAGGTATPVGTTPSVISGIVLNVPGTVSSANLFAEIPNTAAISGRVWLDADNDGLVGPAETLLPGVTLQLSGTSTTGAAVSLTTTTGTDGSYAFNALPPGTYTVTEPTQPANTLSGRTVAGSAGGTASTPAVAPSTIANVVLAATQIAVNYNFGEIPAAQIGGRVWSDANNNGVVDTGETGLAGVALTLSGTNDLGQSVTLAATTGADGSYAFTGLRPGTYTVTEPNQPSGTFNGQTLAGSTGGTPTGVATVPSAIASIVLTAGQGSTANNFGEIPAAQLAGRVWLDANNNGVVDASEAGIAGVTLNLAGTNDLGAAVTATTVTAADGTYAFTNLRPGTYTVTEPTQPANTLNGRTVPGTGGGTATAVSTTPSVIAGIVVTGGQTAGANNFGEITAAQLSGRVWADLDNDGIIDATESGLAGVTLLLTGVDDLGTSINQNVVTGADGRYNFTNLRPGTYQVAEPAQPEGTANGITVAGSSGGTATTVATTPSSISGVVLTVGATATDYNFGEVPNSADLMVSKTHTKATLTVGFTGSYRITVRNAGSLATAGSYTVSDRLPTGLTLASAPTGNGWTCTGAVGASSFACTSSAVIAAGATGAEAITAVVNVGAAAQPVSPVNNAVMIEGGGETASRGPSAIERDLFLNNPAALPVCTAAIAHNVCRDPTPVQLAASVSGTVWTDTGASLHVLDSADRRMAGWLVEVVDPTTGSVLARATTATNGSYRVGGLEPGVPMAVRFREPSSGVVYGYPVNGEAGPETSGARCVSGTPAAGTASSCVERAPNPQLVVVLAAGTDLPQQSLPIDPSGVVYDSVTRASVAGSVVTMAPSGACAGWNPATSVVAATLGGYSVSGDRISMTTGPDGFYQFLLAPAAPASCTFALSVTPPSTYSFASTAIPPTAGPLVPPGAAGSVYAVQPQAGAPTGTSATATAYYLLVTTGSAGANVVHNHIPLDPTTPGSTVLRKTGDRSVAEIGDSVRYTLTLNLVSGARAAQNTVVDRLPAGFTYIAGTASVNGVPIADPAGGVGPTLAFNLGAMPVTNQLELRYRVRVGVGAQQGDGINRAQSHACGIPAGCVTAGFTPVPSAVASNPAEYRVRVLGGVFTTDACVLGKIFVDCNNNHVQDPEELGIPGVRLVLSDGTVLISDSEGKYSQCGLPPRSHVMRVDPGTLPRGSRLTTSSNRNLGDAGSLWLDLKNGELHRADFIEGSCNNSVIEQVKARRAQGEVRSVETEKKGGPALRFDSKAHQLDTLRSPQQGTDGANQQAPKPRPLTPVPPTPSKDETNVPTPDLPMNQPPPRGRESGQPPDSANTTGASTNGGSNGTR